MAKERQDQPSTRKGGDKPGSGDMTVEEAGHKGGQRVKELVEEGKERDEEGAPRRR